ncbi:class I SAM-dependent methyltransferase [Streptomyces sp. WI04-05B]|uniref:class I SAM-dependent methyltransferase n=1 Tax=Streptomyces TaxID=1883 RepID=UPI0029B491EF|nr:MULTISPECIES: methyltransferase domain-containing protein [unclassified Streptomyces]MDX2548624.1 methyltransferase domain-containing protein [Streptomyces sp. WI04-05B]MDX2589053.1 methyltransferase domain-containing protein [Streptomyces sp. WI04-05A]
MVSHSARDFYDQLAEDYHLIYADWSLSVSRQGNALDALIRRRLDSAEPHEVLDCSCGIGTQMIGLAEHGHRVVGSDLSPAAAVRAAAEVRRRGLSAATLAADMRSLPFADASFDVVLSADNSLAHLLTEDDVRRAVGDVRRVVRDSGLLMLSARDYGDARRSQRQSTVPQVTNSEAGQVVTFQLWHWRDNGVYDFDHLQLLPDGDTWQVRVRRATSRAWSPEELAELVRASGFGDVMWHGVEETHFFQPVLTARPVA